MKRSLTWSLLLLLGLGLMPPASAAERVVTVDSFFFEDASPGDGRVVVDQGDTITFRFEGGNEHSATVTGLFDSGVKGGGQSFTTGTLTRPGTYSLFCTEHGAQTHGTTLVVRGPAGASPAASPRPSSAKPTPAPVRTAAPRSTAPRPASSAATAPATKAPVSAAARSTPSRPVAAAAPRGATATPSPSAPVALSPAAPVERSDAGRAWLVPVLVAGLLLLLGGGYALMRRRPTP